MSSTKIASSPGLEMQTLAPAAELQSEKQFDINIFYVLFFAL
jgi:hypothetical protein